MKTYSSNLQWYTALMLVVIPIVFSMPRAHSLPSKEQHLELWRICLGIDSGAGELSAISSAIDNATEFSDKNILSKLDKRIADKVQLPLFGFNSAYHHRRLFHWGYNLVDIEHSNRTNAQYFRQYVKDKIEEQPLSFDEKKMLSTSVFEMVRSSLAERNRLITRVVERSFTFGGHRGLTSATATILYEIHIMADYCDPTITQLGSLHEHVDRELMDLGLDKLQGLLSESSTPIQILKDRVAAIMRDGEPPRRDALKEELLERHRLEILVPVSKVDGLDENQRRALAVLIALSDHLPHVLGRFVSSTTR